MSRVLIVWFERYAIKCYKSGMNQFRGILKNFTAATKWRYFWPVLAVSLLVIAGASSALYTHSARYQTAITPPKTPQIVVVKPKTAETAQPAASQAAPAEEQPTTQTPAAITSNTTSSTKKSALNSTPAQTACNDKINSIYFNYNMSLASENGRHQAELVDIQEAYDLGVYQNLANELANGTTAEQLRDEDLAEENTQWSTKTTQLAADQQAQMKAAGCFGS